MADLSKFNTALAKLGTDIAALVDQGKADQPAIDAATDNVTALDASVVAATTPPAQPTA